MKQLLWIIFVLLPFYASADIIVTKSNGNIEDVTVIKLTATEVVYTQADNQLTLAAETVEGVLYDDGRYVSPPSQSQPQQPSGITTSSVETTSGSTGTVSSSGRGGLMGAFEQFFLEKVQRWEQREEKRKRKMEEYSRSKNVSKEQQTSSDTPVKDENAPASSVSDESNW